MEFPFRARNRLLAEKLKKDENPVDGAVRGLKEELSTTLKSVYVNPNTSYTKDRNTIFKCISRA